MMLLSTDNSSDGPGHFSIILEKGPEVNPWKDGEEKCHD